MSLTNMQVYNTEIQTNTIELLDQMTQKFNAASNGSILLTSVRNEGDFAKEAFWNNLASAQRRVDRYAANGDVAATSISQGELVSVKVAGGFGPILMEPSQLTWLQRDPGEAITAISQSFADALLADQLNTAIASAVAAIENQAALVNDVSATGAITQNALNGSHAKFGDMSGQLVADVMTGSTYHRLIDQSITNSGQLFVAGNVRVVDILGKAIVVTDAPALFEAGTPDKDKVLSLVAGGIQVSDNGDLVTNMDTSNGKGRIETTWQADYSFQIGLKGYAWDVTNGGKSPTDAELATGTNWDKAVAFDKHTAGTLAIGSAA
ncbi:putative major capsid protein [Vibrio phage 242E40-1]|nr:putative major capsid protein [Vibrio phage 242E40-1]